MQFWSLLIMMEKCFVSCSCSCQHGLCWCLHCILGCNLYRSKSRLLSMQTMNLETCSRVLPESAYQNAWDPACHSSSLASLSVLAQRQFWLKALQTVSKATAWRQKGRDYSRLRSKLVFKRLSFHIQNHSFRSSDVLKLWCKRLSALSLNTRDSWLYSENLKLKARN